MKMILICLVYHFNIMMEMMNLILCLFFNLEELLTFSWGMIEADF